jgi:hypothetical protein
MAIVSREAANLIGMKSGAITKISIVQPTEPIAYYRFTEGLLSGNPVYDSGNAIRDRMYNEDTFAPSDGEKTEPVIGISGPRYILEPEWQNREIVDFYPDTVRRPPVIIEKEPEYAAEEEPEYVAEEEPVEEESPYVAEEEPVEEETPYVAEEEPVEEESPYIAEEEPVEEIVEKTEIVEKPKYDLVPDKERPPEGWIYDIDPNSLIPSISDTVVRETQTPSVPVASQNVFSVRETTRLERGRYYVQIAAFRTVESTENALRQIRQILGQIEGYGPVVFIDSDNSYKILLGDSPVKPLNQGESAAVLQRFKSIGYKDAFVRHVR